MSFDFTLSRRRFLELLAAGAAVGATGCEPLPPIAENPFTLGVASGDPLVDRVVLWTRLAPDPLAADGAAGMQPYSYPVTWEVAHDDAFAQIVRQGVAVAAPSLGHSVHVDVNGLDPDRWYFYRFRTMGWVSAVGRTRTMPLAASAPALLRFGTASCQNYTNGYYTAHASLAYEELDLVVFLGDYIYEGGVAGRIRNHDGPRIQSLAGYRNRYALYKLDAELALAHQNFPWIVTWDDHEVANNYAGDIQGQANTVPFLSLRAWAYQAWYENMPVRVQPPKGSSLRIYRDLAFGDLASFFVLDGRQYRTDQQCNDNPFQPICDGFPAEDGEMIGAAQESWLLGGIGASQARWNVLAQQVVFAPTPLGEFRNYDQWDGYPFARQRITDFLRARPNRNNVVLTGDIHASGVAWVPGEATGAPETFADPVASEFVTTSISSAGLDPGTASLIQSIFASFQHVQHFDPTVHGYQVHTVTRDEWRVDVRVVDTIDETASDISTPWSFVVENGNPIPQPA